MDIVQFDDFLKIELKVGEITSAEAVENSEKLLKLGVDFGESGKRQIIAGIAKFYTPDQLTGKQAVFIINLQPRMLAGLDSQGMMLCADDGGPVILSPDKKISNGSIIK